MAIAVASVSTNYKNYTASSPTTITVTAPTGIATGDLLIIMVGTQAVNTPTGGSLENYGPNSGRSTCTGFTEGYFHSYDVNANSGVGGTARVNVLYKIAVLADESATEYVVTHDAGTSFGAAVQMLRITGWTSGNPFAHGLYLRANHVQDGSATLSASGSMARGSQCVMLMYVCTGGDEDFGFSYASYASTPSETWTEASDTAFGYTDYDGGAFAVAYATTSDTNPLTAIQLAKTLDSSDGTETTVMGVIPIFTPVNASGNAGLHSGPDADFYSNQGVSDATGNSALLQANASHVAQSGSAVSNSQWTAESKPTTTWTPQS